jgi:hypothetical protein
MKMCITHTYMYRTPENTSRCNPFGATGQYIGLAPQAKSAASRYFNYGLRSSRYIGSNVGHN